MSLRPELPASVRATPAIRWAALTTLCTLTFATGAGCGDSESTGGGGTGGTGGSGSSGGSGGSGAGSQCGQEVCVVVPEGWNGPLQVDTDDAGDPICPDEYPITMSLGYVGTVTAEPAECACTCDDPTGESCSIPAADNVTLTGGFEGAACAGNTCGGDTTMDAGTCVPVIQGGCSLSKDVLTSATDVSAASCAPNATVDLPVLMWTESARICGAPPLAQCGDGFCVAKGPTCISQAGDVECPDGYDEKTLVHANAEDTRGCSECTCGAVMGSTCEGTMTAHSNGACDTVLSTTPVPGCIEWLPTAGTTHIQFNLQPTGGTCTASGGEPEGDVVPGSSTTVCCSD